TVMLGIEVSEVEKTAATLAKVVAENNGRLIESHDSHNPNGQKNSKLIFDVPLASAGTLVTQLKNVGTVRSQQATRNTDVPEHDLAGARLDVVLSNVGPIVSNDDGLWNSIRAALYFSFKGFSWSLMMVIIGLLFVLPWAAVSYTIYRVVARM